MVKRKKWQKLERNAGFILGTIMSKRDTFPFAADRAVVDAFLLGRKTMPITDSGVALVAGTLHIGSGGPASAHPISSMVAGFDTGGSLMAMPGWDLMGGYTIHLIHYMLAELGSDARIVRQREIAQVGDAVDKMLDDGSGVIIRYFYDGREIVSHQPIILAGPLSVQAYRVTKIRSA